MNTVLLYKVTCTRGQMMGEQGTNFSLQPWGNNTREYEGHDDGGRHYTLPEGYSVGKSKSGTEHIYDDKKNYCNLVVGKDGNPVTVSPGKTVALQPTPFPTLDECTEYVRDTLSSRKLTPEERHVIGTLWAFIEGKMFPETYE